MIIQPRLDYFREGKSNNSITFTQVTKNIRNKKQIDYFLNLCNQLGWTQEENNIKCTKVLKCNRDNMILMFHTDR